MILEPSGEYLELYPAASDYIADIAGLPNTKAATKLSLFNPVKWEYFTDALTGWSAELENHPMYTNGDGTVIYSFLENPLEEEVSELALMYEQFAENHIQVRTVLFDGTKVGLLAVETRHTESYTIDTINIFFPETASITCFAIRTDTLNNVKVYKVFDAKLIGKKHAFSLLDVDFSGYEYSIINMPEFQPENDESFRFSLFETIQLLRTMQSTKQLATDAAQWLGEIIEEYGFIDPSLSEKITNLYEKLPEYYFYYDNTRTTVTDPDLIHDKLKTAKPHLYFSKDLIYKDMMDLLGELTLVEFRRVIHANAFEPEILKLLAYLNTAWIVENKLELDALQIPFFWDGTTE